MRRQASDQGAVAKELPAIREMLPNGIVFTEVSMTAEDDRVIAELRGRSKTVNGDDYNNHYCHYYQIRGKQIVAFRDYMDSALVERLMVPSLQRMVPLPKIARARMRRRREGNDVRPMIEQATAARVGRRRLSLWNMVRLDGPVCPSHVSASVRQRLAEQPNLRER